MSPDQSITELLPALMDGESMAVQVVWDRFFANLCRVAHKRLASGRVGGGDEEDAAAIAFASVCRRLKQGDFPDVSNRDELWRLLVTVVERKACTMLRAEARQKRGGGKVLGESVFRGLDPSKPMGIQTVAGAEPSPDFVVEMADTMNQLFEPLDEQSRQIAVLKLEGYRNDEIARKLGRSLATIERKLKLIRATWSARFDELPSDSG
jgi:DNA-directed RNA polymerase specialized sigma24 family protein